MMELRWMRGIGRRSPRKERRTRPKWCWVWVSCYPVAPPMGIAWIIRGPLFLMGRMRGNLWRSSGLILVSVCRVRRPRNLVRLGNRWYGRMRSRRMGQWVLVVSSRRRIGPSSRVLLISGTRRWLGRCMGSSSVRSLRGRRASWLIPLLRTSWRVIRMMVMGRPRCALRRRKWSARAWERPRCLLVSIRCRSTIGRRARKGPI